VSCSIADYISQILAAYQALCGSCCDPTTDCLGLLPDNLSTMCGDGTGLLVEIHTAVRSLVDATPASCTTVTEGDAADPGLPEGCLDAIYLQSLLDWITGLTCSDHGDCPPENCFHLSVHLPTAIPGLPPYYLEVDVIWGPPPFGECFYSSATGSQLWWDTLGAKWANRVEYPGTGGLSFPSISAPKNNPQGRYHYAVGVEDDNYMDVQACTAHASRLQARSLSPKILVSPSVRMLTFEQLAVIIEALPERARREGVKLVAEKAALIRDPSCSGCRRNQATADVRIWYQTYLDSISSG